MKLKIIGSSSKGNAYILENDHEALIIECGVALSSIKQALNFKIGKVVGCLVTHEHQDHCKAAADVVKAGINIYASQGTIAKIKPTLPNHRYKAIDKLQELQLGGFKIMAFDVKHDAQEPIGFLIWHQETGTVLFLTDTYYSPFTFTGLNNIIVEANYSSEIIKQKQELGLLPLFLKDRILSSHLSIENCVKLLKANDLTKVNNIVLIHLSDSNSNEEQFVEQVKKATGRTVTAAKAGITINNFNLTPF